MDDVICFEALGQSELLRLSAGGAVSVQGRGRMSVFQHKNGEHRSSLDVTANYVLALRQPKKESGKRKNRRRNQASTGSKASKFFKRPEGSKQERTKEDDG
jgi:single-stranded DNA-binding protein